jgi:phage terminase large subunit-like protein
MPLASPPPAAASYLRAINAACIHITPGPLIGATAGLPRQAIWAAWCKDLESARKVATPDLLVRTCDDGIRVGRTVEQLVAAIEQRAKQLRIVLTPHNVAVERALKLAMAVDGTLATLQARGDLKAFNRSYRRYRIEATARAKK